ncbi:hypothetical protein D0Q02_05640 [Micromonospora craniellae]|uniref:Uncharacterized protein n=1 Tax=Micromonospora craniellae TaxID=2294034 RepID=A0A372G349_9ACTN|nr:hypothetical protein D0Q02_05640 [Micromonospora craniellae]
MTAPFLSLAQIRNRLILAARWVLRDHRPGPDGFRPICRAADCPVAQVAGSRTYSAIRRPGMTSRSPIRRKSRRS